MAFESLTDKLQNVFKKLRSKGVLTEEDVKAALKEVRMALLEADVNFKVVKQFTKSIEEKAVGSDIMNGLNPGQQVIKLVNEEMTSLMGSEAASLKYANAPEPTVIMMAGLNGAGKTTTCGKLALHLKGRSKKTMLAALDVYRPAAIEQLKVNGAKVDTRVFEMGTDRKPVDIAKAALDEARKEHFDVVILDTAGRQQIDEALMEELHDIKEQIQVDDTLLVVDAGTGQAAVDVALGFDEKVGIDGVILTKLDGDTRGGAALSIKAVTGKPVLYAASGEKPQDFDIFYPDRMAGRILGMGDVLSLIEKAGEAMDEEDAKKAAESLKKGRFTFNDYLDSMKQVNKLGGMGSVISMLGMGGKGGLPEIDETMLKRNEAIIMSMTPAERDDPKLLNPRRKMRIAKGSGVDIMYVNRLVKQFEQMQKMMKQFTGGGKKRGRFGQMAQMQNMMRSIKL
ncbi:MAG TPA: signal recognition particle protein [Lachnospiraceae bacterium]|nr:signal recognition particle protein [Lachnospiraceae bacterium]MBQ9566723.1 signal recognition particle protein [Lachnospiraceae bacterium]HAL32132.1 signal recognition particle protein [Lachnospiraceae bacterium]HBB59391.1 signal recognition particle protein [Lachnospiraceae bacterium]HCR99773.1 signal recognition particle protein [Lachnospiraceae bacterium]